MHGQTQTHAEFLSKLSSNVVKFLMEPEWFHNKHENTGCKDGEVCLSGFSG